MKTENLLQRDGELYYIPDFFSSMESELLFKTIVDETPWRNEPIKIFGKEVMQPRLTAWFGEKSYTYSGITMVPYPWTDSLIKIKKQVESFSGDAFNTALLNLYRDQNDSMGWHRDNEKELGVNPVIASVSFGETRTFKMKHRELPDLKISLEVKNGSLILMKGSSQHHWLHSVTKTAKEKLPRLNITFRKVWL